MPAAAFPATFAIVQNDSGVPAGSCPSLIEAAGAAHLTIPAYTGLPLPDPAPFAGVIVLGGAMGVHEGESYRYLAAVQHFMTCALRQGVPLLGICLGGQLLADLTGGSVTPSSGHGEKGVHQVTLTPEGRGDPLFAGVPTVFTTFQWHEDSLLPPPGGVLLARSQRCPWQAFRCAPTAYGIQFHPEVDRGIVSDWCGCTAAAAQHLPAFDAAAPTFAAHSHAIITNFISLARNARRP